MMEQQGIVPDICSYVSSMDDFLNFHSKEEQKAKAKEVFGGIYQENRQQTHGDITKEQADAWTEEIEDLMDTLKGAGAKGWIIFEYSIYRLGDRVDVILLMDSVVYSLEFKTGKQKITEASQEQAIRYAYDLKNFHQASKNLWVCPILVIQDDYDLDALRASVSRSESGLFELQSTSQKGLGTAIAAIAEANPKPQAKIEDDRACLNWIKSKTEPSPDILRATKYLYDQLSGNPEGYKHYFKCDPAHPNITNTTDTVETILRLTKASFPKNKAIIFVAGVPGAGKTVVGLNIAFKHANPPDRAVFVSGNGPLVTVLQATLRHAIKDEYEIKRSEASTPEEASRLKAEQKDKLGNKRGIAWMIEQFTSYKKALSSEEHNDEHIVVFDEAQRAWTQGQMAKYETKKAKQAAKGSGDSFGVIVLPSPESEPLTLLNQMFHDQTWGVVVCLVGLGQDIHNGEEGINEWFRSCLNAKYKDLQIYMGKGLIDQKIDPIEDSLKEQLLTSPNAHFDARWNDLYLSKSLRNVTGDCLHEFTEAVLSGDVSAAAQSEEKLEAAGYQIRLSRDYKKAKMWLYEHRSPGGRWGVIASSHADRLKDDGITSDERFSDMDKWFFAPSSDPESSNSMQTVMSEFSIEGLELDRACVCWDLDFYWDGSKWVPQTFAPTTGWRIPKTEQIKRYIHNSYRVLLTRSRFGFVIYVPDTSSLIDPITGRDIDGTRPHAYYDRIAKFFTDIGIQEI
jgi:KaiC/GvpD/RAD55 family RecA-like ATPase